MNERSGHHAGGGSQWRLFEGDGWIDQGWINGKRKVRIDPYMVWAELTGYAYLNGRPAWTPILIELRRDHHLGTASKFANSSLNAALIKVPGVYKTVVTAPDTHFCTAVVRGEFFEALNSGSIEEFQAIERFELSLPVVSDANTVSPIHVDKVLDGPTFVGVIDDGLAFAHRNFRDGLGTRVEYFWNQEPDPRVPAKPESLELEPKFGYSPTGLGYGWEIAKRKLKSGPDGIDELLQKSTHVDLVDEDEVYAKIATGTVRQPNNLSTRRRAAHGTHVMDLAAGSDAADPCDFSVIAVQLPSRTTRDTSGASLGMQVLDAMRYIIDRANSLATTTPPPPADGGPPPIVVNLSYGTIAGPHDGTSILEAALDELIALRQRPLEVVLPAGNNFLSRCHARNQLANGQTCSMQWRVLPDDKTPSFLEIWMPRVAGGDTKVEVTLTTPTGDTSPPVTEGTAVQWMPDGNAMLALVVYMKNPTALGNDRNMVSICLRPTATENPDATIAPIAPSGIWTIKVKNVSVQVRDPITLDAWIQRDDTAFGNKIRGRQSRFVDPRYDYADPATGQPLEIDNGSPLRREGTISAIATGYNTIVMGGFRATDRGAASGSASGPICPPPPTASRTRDGPDAMAVSEDSTALRSVLAAGTRSGSFLALTGTSVGAPQMTRQIAQWMAKGQPSGWKAVRDLAQAEEAKVPAGEKPVPTARKGHGRIRLKSRHDRGIA